MGAAMVLAMHAGFAFLEVGSVRKTNQVNALMKIISDFSISTVAYFLIGYYIAYKTSFLKPVSALEEIGTIELVRFFFLLTFAAAIPAIISGGISERARFLPQLIASALVVALVYPLFEGIAWGKTLPIVQETLESIFGAKFHDFAGSVVVHVMGGWLA
ncbi:MAG TPA: ammonium transporter, partial [Acidiferrobacteraceae bacterium]|nr:ammonium transporter [Acidiferrobacteraceae bacterium]HEX20086.1 ammonium transporter [Acidiferrobacteraceae bacterium]